MPRLAALLLLLSSTSIWALPDEWIFAQGFESQSVLSMEGDQSFVFTQAGQRREFSLNVTDGQETALPGRKIVWYLTNTDRYLLANEAGYTTEVETTDNTTGSAQLFAVDPGFGSSIAIAVATASMQPGAIYVASSEVRSGSTPLAGSTEVVLAATVQTQNLEVGDVIVSGDERGLLVRVVSVDANRGDEVALTVEAAKITDAFESLSVVAKSLPESRSYQLDDSPGAGIKRLSDDLDCETGGENAVGFEVSEPFINLSFDVSTEVVLEVSAGLVNTFSVAAVAQAGLEAQTGTLTYQSNISGKVICTFQLPEIFTPPVPVSAFSFQLNTAPTVGFEFEAGFSGPSFVISGPSGELGGSATAGVVYQFQTGWGPLAETQWNGNFEPLSAELNTDISFTAKGGPFATNEFGFVANLGRPPLGVQLADIRFIRLKALAELDLALATPLNPERKDYVGPRWDIDGIITGQYQAALADGLLYTLLNALDVPTQIDALTGDIFDPIQIRIAEAPEAQIAISCFPNCPLDPLNNESAQFTLTGPAGLAGQATIVGAKDGSTFVSDLVTTNVINGTAMGAWFPSEFDEGTYEVFPRLVTDTLSQFFPYGGTQGQLLNVNSTGLPTLYVGQVDSLDVNESGQIAYVATRSECGYGSAVFLNNAVYACPPLTPREWGLANNRPVRLSDRGKVAFDVFRWELDGGEWQGIFNGPNPGGQANECWTGDTVIAGAYETFSTNGYFVSDIAANGDVVWIERRGQPNPSATTKIGIRTDQRCEGFSVFVSNPRKVRLDGNRHVVVSTRARLLSWAYPATGWDSVQRNSPTKQDGSQPPSTVLLDEENYITEAPFLTIDDFEVNSSGLVAFVACYEEDVTNNEICDIGTVNQTGSVTLIDRLGDDGEDYELRGIRIAESGVVAYCRDYQDELALFTSDNVIDPFVAEGHEIGNNHLLRDINCDQFGLSPSGLIFSAVAYEADNFFTTTRGIFRVGQPLEFPTSR